MTLKKRLDRLEGATVKPETEAENAHAVCCNVQP